MTIVNKTRKAELASKAVICQSLPAITRGLMFRRQTSAVLELPKESDGAIHTFFVFFPIDVLWIKEGKVVDFARNVQPFTVRLASNEPTTHIVELPEGTIDKTETDIGDEIVYKQVKEIQYNEKTKKN